MPQLLYAAAFALEDRELFADFSCGDEPWSLAAAEWIQGDGVEKSVKQHGTQVWLFRRDSDDQLIGFGSLGRTRRRWPPPTGPYINLLIIPQLAVDIRFHGQPADDPPRYSHQILGHLIAEARRQAVPDDIIEPAAEGRIKHLHLIGPGRGLCGLASRFG
jgi:hypothetical protein